MTQHLGPYELRGELGRGAMAIVWRGYDPKLEREVAIKEPVISATADDAARADLSERFVREGRAAAKLNHPGIVTIHAADVFDGRPAIVMELIEGETLSAVLDRGPLPATAAVAVLDQLLDAVAYAHEHGIVHRDIKPDNVFVTPDGRIKLADFGIAHVGSSSTLTQAGTVMGTPGYMAPEQVTGQPIDARADIFAVGAIAYEMLAGTNPFGATEGVAPTTVMYRVVHETPPALPDDAFAGLPANLAPVIATALAKDPASRFSDARAFRSALSGGPIVTGAMAGVPGAPTVVASPPVWGNTAAATVANRPSEGANLTPYLIFGVVALIGVVAMFMFSGTPPVPPPPPPPETTDTPTGTPKPPPPTPPVVRAHELTPNSASARSSAAENYSAGTDYVADNVLDGDPTTAWEEGVGGYGLGQWLQADFGQPVALSEIRVMPGYNKVDAAGVDRWKGNGRVAGARFTFSDGTTKKFYFKDKRGWQTVRFGTPKVTRSVRMTIVSAYHAGGSHASPDTSVSEMAFSGWLPGESR